METHETWSLALGVGALLLSGLTFVVNYRKSNRAEARAEAALQAADEANSISKDANRISSEALQSNEASRADAVRPVLKFPVAAQAAKQYVFLENTGRGTASKIRASAEPLDGVAADDLERAKSFAMSLEAEFGSGDRTLSPGERVSIRATHGKTFKVRVCLEFEDELGNPCRLDKPLSDLR